MVIPLKSVGFFRSSVLLLLVPISWGLLSYFAQQNIVVVNSIVTISAPTWVVAWLFALTCLIPFWFWLANNNYKGFLVEEFPVRGVKVQTGSPIFYLFIAYLFAASAVWFHDGWYGHYFVFGGIVSPMIEELFTRYLLSPFIGASTKIFFLMASISSSAFAVMHWGFSAGVFDLSVQDQIVKFLTHFGFGMALSVLFRWVRCIGPVIWVHMMINWNYLIGLN